MKSTLESGENVLISGFGKFCVKEKRERRGRNPTTGDDLMLGQAGDDFSMLYCFEKQVKRRRLRL